MSVVASKNRPGLNESKAARVFTNVWPSTITRCPENPKPPPKPTATSTPSSAVWKTRLPVSRRYPRSAETDGSPCSSYRSTRYPAWRSCFAAASIAASAPVPSGSGRSVYPANRESRAGVRGGLARSASRWCFVRGMTQPMSDTKSSR